MPFVALVGAGKLGGSIARAIAGRGRVGEIRLIDDAADVAAGKALDIQQAAAVDGSPTRISGSDDLTQAVGAAAVVLADRVGAPTSTGEWTGDEGLALIERLVRIERGLAIVCAGSRQHDLLERGLLELRLRRTRFFGTAPEAIVSALRALVALQADVSPTAVGLTALGRMPDRIVVPWREATVAGRPIIGVLSAAQLARLERWTASIGSATAQDSPGVLGSLGPYALSAAAARAAEMLVTGSRKVVCCSVGLEGEFGIRRGVSAMPVVIGPGGIVRVMAPPLDGREQVLLENALAAAE